MFVKQVSVFLENRAGTLAETADILKEREINILSLSLVSTDCCAWLFPTRKRQKTC